MDVLTFVEAVNKESEASPAKEGVEKGSTFVKEGGGGKSRKIGKGFVIVGRW